MTLVIQIRGTSGSGKTTVARDVIERFKLEAAYTDGRRNPIWYTKDRICILGSYESTCGGCDNVGAAPACYNLLQEAKKEHDVVIMEGLLLSEDKKWTKQMQDDGDEVKVLFLNTPLSLCINRVKARRLAAGNYKPFNEANTTKRVDVIGRAKKVLVEYGVACFTRDIKVATSCVWVWTIREIKELI